MLMKYYWLLGCLLLGLLPLRSLGQGRPATRTLVPRLRVIVDNDFAGDPDGLFQLAHLLLSPSVEVRAIIGSRLGELEPSATQAEQAVQKAAEVLHMLGMSGRVPVLAGANRPMPNDSTPVESEGAVFIEQEALRPDPRPLYVLCGGGLTQVASAALRRPTIADRVTLVWIGGPEYPGLALPPPGADAREFNTSIDVAAAQAVFNRTRLPLWQVPRDAYRQVLLSHAQLLSQVRPRGRLGRYLYTTLETFIADKIERLFHLNTGEVYVLGDSPLVLLTALQSSAEPDASSSRYVLRPAPHLTAQGTYEAAPAGRLVRVYTQLDTALLLNDFLAKLTLRAR